MVLCAPVCVCLHFPDDEWGHHCSVFWLPLPPTRFSCPIFRRPTTRHTHTTWYSQTNAHLRCVSSIWFWALTHYVNVLCSNYMHHCVSLRHMWSVVYRIGDKHHSKLFYERLANSEHQTTSIILHNDIVGIGGAGASLTHHRFQHRRGIWSHRMRMYVSGTYTIPFIRFYWTKVNINKPESKRMAYCVLYNIMRRHSRGLEGTCIRFRRSESEEGGRWPSVQKHEVDSPISFIIHAEK